MAAAGVSVVVAAEDGFHPCGGQRCDSGKGEEGETLKRFPVQKVTAAVTNEKCSFITKINPPKNQSDVEITHNRDLPNNATTADAA